MEPRPKTVFVHFEAEKATQDSILRRDPQFFFDSKTDRPKDMVDVATSFRTATPVANNGVLAPPPIWRL